MHWDKPRALVILLRPAPPLVMRRAEFSMLILSRVAGESVYVGSPGESCLVTVLKVLSEAEAIEILVNRALAAHPGALECQTHRMVRGAVVRLSESSTVTLIDIREEKARIGIEVPKGYSVHRLEVYDAIRRKGNDFDEGLGGARVPRPPSPQPPSLDVRLDEPP